MPSAMRAPTRVARDMIDGGVFPFGGHKGFEYSRSGNPTRSALEAQVTQAKSA